MAITFKTKAKDPAQAQDGTVKKAIKKVLMYGKAMASVGDAAQQASDAATRLTEALAEVGLGPTTTVTPPKVQNAPQALPEAQPEAPVKAPPMVHCAGCGKSFPADVEQGDLSQAVKTNVSFGFEPDDAVVVTNSLYRWNTRYKAGDTGVVLSCRMAGSTPYSRYTIVEVQLDKPRERGHDKVWLHIWELDRKCP